MVFSRVRMFLASPPGFSHVQLEGAAIRAGRGGNCSCCWTGTVLLVGMTAHADCEDHDQEHEPGERASFHRPSRLAQRARASGAGLGGSVCRGYGSSAMDLQQADLPLLDFAIALFLGALVGLEREKKQTTEPERGIGGLRTFMLFAEAGAVAAWLSLQTASPWIFVATGALVTTLVVVGYLAWVRKQRDDVGLTTETAAIVVYLLGGLTIYGNAGLAVALAIATAAILAFKQPLHGWVDRVGRDDLYAGLTLLIATFIVLPVLPDRTLDPWQALNPYAMW